MDRQGRQATACDANSFGLGRPGKPRSAASDAASARSPEGKISGRSRPNSKCTSAVQGPKPGMAAMAATAASSGKTAKPSAESWPLAKASAKARAWLSLGRDRPACRNSSSFSSSSPQGVVAPGRLASRPQIAVAAWLEIICPQRLRSSPGKPASRRRQGNTPACSGMEAISGSHSARASRASAAQPGASGANMPAMVLGLAATQHGQLGKGIARRFLGRFFQPHRQMRPSRTRIGVEGE